MRKWLMFIGPILIAGLLWWITVQPGTAIVEATVLGTREDSQAQPFFPGRYLSLVNITKAYPTKMAMYSTRSDCPLAIGQQIFVAVGVTNGIVGHSPTSANTTLYKEQGLGFVRWDGCN